MNVGMGGVMREIVGMCESVGMREIVIVAVTRDDRGGVAVGTQAF